MPQKPLTAERLRALIKYYPQSGKFVWRSQRPCRVKPGYVAGTVHADNRRVITIDGHRFYAARLAWLWQTGDWPPPGLEVDHRDNDASNDAWHNLCLLTHPQNLMNRQYGTKGEYAHDAA